ncbi:hypothetical protein VXN63_08135 [Marinilactibacillus sp. XAAS-LB27]|uniref:hypothetical protein n=1 Tax=Marinilactibacillus sp. XAAS-LB27 TaxID=3114538 RepID=UPI002E16C72E|nr:hypothetical protein [Marinilactibacillus sp. XAAS-LB27]
MSTNNAPFPLINTVQSGLGTTDIEIKNGPTESVQKIVVEEENVVFYVLPNDIFLYSHPLSTGREWHSNGAISLNEEDKLVIELV